MKNKKVVEEEYIKQINNLITRCGVGFDLDDIEALIYLLRKNEELKQELEKKDDIINETRNAIKHMLTNGYAKGLTFYYPTKDGEFGARAEILLEILGEKNESK